MDDDAPHIYGLEFQARALTAQVAETDMIRFLVGTQSLRFENQIHHIDFDDENNVVNKSVYLHKAGEIWHLSSSPIDKSVLVSCYNCASEGKAEMKAAVWQIPDSDNAPGDDNSVNAPSVELLTELDSSGYGQFSRTVWHPSGETSELIAIADNHLVLYDIQESGQKAKVISTAMLEGKGQPKFTSGRWNPHHNCSQLATASETCIRGWDVRSMQQVYCVDNAHGQLVRELDFNPNKQYYLASCGDDCKTKFWDTRKLNEPLKTSSDHSHWVWSVRYNHFHDELVLTSSSDSRVILTNAASISSEPFGRMAEDEDIEEEDQDDKDKKTEPLPDGVIRTYEEHEDSVYAAEWSTADPWLFASLSYDGRLVINRVPRAVKYKILL